VVAISASIGAVGAIALAARKTAITPLLVPVVQKTTQITAMIFLILIGATLFSLVFRALGGDDMDHAVAEWIMQQAGMQDSVDHKQLRRLLRDARAAKETLTHTEQTALHIELDKGQRWDGILTREILNTLIDPLIDRTLPACKRVLRDAGIRPNDVDGVVLVGGATRVPRVREKVEKFFARAPLTNIDPDKVVAIGAALQADVLIGNKRSEEMLLLDVIPLSLGIEIMGGMVEKLIPRNTTIPVAKGQDFTTFKDGQTALLIHVLQGERELVSDCRSLARFELRGASA